MDQTSDFAKEQWPGDVLERRPYANFLTDYLVSKVKGPDGKCTKSFTLALDAKWGQGKTFFVTNWAKDLGSATPAYPIQIFDAWSADHVNDPLVAFMATFKAAIDERIDAAGLSAPLKERAAEHIAAAVSGFRRAILPAGKQIAKGLLQKATGIALDELYEACINNSDSGVPRNEEKMAKAGIEALNKGLDEFFGKALEEQGKRQHAIQEFRGAIEAALRELVDHDAISLPMFVFIDEVDRCRPNFAIALLEGIKHLFGIPGVCFVVSTNMAQLSESIKSVYGRGFDGYGYLKRFFDVEYCLPIVSGRHYMRLLLTEHPDLENYNLALGLPTRGFSNENEPMDACYVLTWVAETFGLDLRSQRTVVEVIVAAAAGVPKGKKVYLLWLAVLCAMRHTYPEAFESLAVNRESQEAFKDAWNKADVADKGRLVELPQSPDGAKQTIKLQEVAWHYYNAMRQDLRNIRDDQEDSNIYDYPRSVVLAIVEEMPNPSYRNMAYPPSIGTYFHLVRTAGHLVAF